MNSFRAISRVKCLYETDVSGTISSLLLLLLMMMTEMVIERPVSYRHLRRLTDGEDFIGNYWCSGLHPPYSILKRRDCTGPPD